MARVPARLVGANQNEGVELVFLGHPSPISSVHSLCSL
jgi:hypothetical protein